MEPRSNRDVLSAGLTHGRRSTRGGICPRRPRLKPHRDWLIQCGTRTRPMVRPPDRGRLASQHSPLQPRPCRLYAAPMTKHPSDPRTEQNMSARDQMKQRCFLPKQRDTILQTLRYALRVKSDADLPKVFQLPVAVALKPGSWDELAARFNVPAGKTDPRRMAFESARALYCRSSQYGHALLNCEQLFSIDMEPDGPPGPADRKLGRALLGQPAQAKPGKTGKAERSGPPPEPTTVGRSEASVPSPENEHSARHPTVQATPDKPAAPNHPQRSPLERRKFHPVQRQKILEHFRIVLGLDSKGDLPAYLKEELAVPLRVGYSKDLVLRYNVPRRKKDPRSVAFGRAMDRYTNSRAYQHALLTCETRFTIDMEPAEPITDADREQAIATLGEMNRRRQERESRNQLRQASQAGPEKVSSDSGEPDPGDPNGGGGSRIGSVGN